jgi:hypothetical protein
MRRNLFVCYLTLVLVLRQYSVDDRMINECGVAGVMRIGRGNRSTGRKPAPVPQEETYCPAVDTKVRH